jgi:hypothetical protein
MTPEAPATEKQVALLVRLGMKPEIASTLSKNEACIEIKARLDQPTIRQKIFLLRRGVPVALIEIMTKEEARQMIGGILAGR